MNTLHDLRETLGREAAGVDDTERHLRATAVRQRVRVVRRRRVGVVAVAAAVVMVAAVSITGMLARGGESPEPAGVLGVEVPAQVTVLGLTYDLEDAREVTPGDPVRVSSADQLGAGADAVVIMVATGLGDGSATLTGDGAPVARLHPGHDLSVPVGSYRGSLVNVQVDLDGAAPGARVAIAVYRSPARAGTRDTVDYFRDDSGERLLLGADLAAAGESSVEVAVDGPVDDLTLKMYCHSDRPDLYTRLEVDGATVSQGVCEIPANSGDLFPEQPVGDGRHLIRLVLTQGEDGDPVAVGSGTVLGLGAYQPTTSRQVLGDSVTETVEYGGRRWALDEVVDQPAPGQPLDTTIDTSAGDLLLGYITRGGARVSWTGGLVGKHSDSFPPMGPGAQDLLAGILLAGDSYDVIARPIRANGELALLVYRPV